MGGGEWFAIPGFLTPKKKHFRTGATFAITLGILQGIVLSVQTFGVTNHDTSTNPYFISAMGDVDAQLRLSHAVVESGPLRISTGVRGGARLLQGTQANPTPQGPEFGPRLFATTSPYARGLITIEAESVRMSLDAGFLKDNSPEVLDVPFEPSYGQRYAYGVSDYDAFLFGAAIDLPAHHVAPFVEINARGDIGAPGEPAVVGTAGFKFATPRRHLALTLAGDVGLLGRKIEEGRLRVPEWNVVGSVSVSIGAMRARAPRPPPPPRVYNAGTSPSTGKLRGRVVEASTRTAIGQAKLVLESGQELYSDASGNFQFVDLPHGPKRILVTHPYYEEKQGVAFVTAGQVTSLTLQLVPNGTLPAADASPAPPAVVPTPAPSPAPATESKPVIVAAAAPVPTGKLRGRILDAASRQPIAQAKLVMETGEVMWTDAKGAFEFPTLPHGPKRIKVTHPSYAEKQGLTFITAGQATSLNLQLTGLGTLHGRVVTFTGRPLAGAKIHAEAGGKSAETTTDDKGMYELPLATGDFRLAITADGYQVQYPTGSLKPGDRTQLDFMLEAVEKP